MCLFLNLHFHSFSEEEGSDSIDTEVFPAAMKTAMRFHIQKLCGTPHCVDSLVFYLNNPTRHDGSMLLWDVDNDGKVGRGFTLLARATMFCIAVLPIFFPRIQFQ